MSTITRKTIGNAYEMRNEPYRVRIYMEKEVAYFSAADIAMACGTSAPYGWIRKLSFAKNPVIKCVKIKYPVMKKNGVISSYIADFVTADDAKRIIRNFPVWEEMKNWLLNDVLTFAPPKNPAIVSGVEVSAPDHGKENADYEKRIDEIIMELLEIKRSIKMKNKVA